LLVLYFVLLYFPDPSSFQLKKRLFLTLSLKKTNYVSGNQKVVETPLATEFSIDDDECCLEGPCKRNAKNCHVLLLSFSLMEFLVLSSLGLSHDRNRYVPSSQRARFWLFINRKERRQTESNRDSDRGKAKLGPLLCSGVAACRNTVVARLFQPQQHYTCGCLRSSTWQIFSCFLHPTLLAHQLLRSIPSLFHSLIVVPGCKSILLLLVDSLLFAIFQASIFMPLVSESVGANKIWPSFGRFDVGERCVVYFCNR
jgi:hypothetical protein